MNDFLSSLLDDLDEDEDEDEDKDYKKFKIYINKNIY